MDSLSRALHFDSWTSKFTYGNEMNKLCTDITHNHNNKVKNHNSFCTLFSIISVFHMQKYKCEHNVNMKIYLNNVSIATFFQVLLLISVDWTGIKLIRLFWAAPVPKNTVHHIIQCETLILWKIYITKTWNFIRLTVTSSKKLQNRKFENCVRI